MKSIINDLNNGVQNHYPTGNKNLKTQLYGIVILISLFLFFNSHTYATHVVGGGITYVQLENNNYLLTVKLYRDCSPGTAQLPGNVNVQCRRGNTGAVPPGFSSLVLPLKTVTQLNPAIPACAFDPGICVQEAIYQDTVNIPPGAGGYHLYFTICCRNATIVNITNPLGARETYYAYIPDNGSLQSQVNSSPYFNDVPPVYVCQGQPLDLSFMASDPDGDSLDYYFYTPYDGTAINYGVGTPPNNINIQPVNWQAGFGATDPLDPAAGFLPGLTIDNNGFITGIPPAAGQYVVGVMVDEYRNGVLIGRVSRDFQFNVIICPPPLQAVIGTTSNCNGLTVSFLNQSTGNPSTAWWNFDTGNPADTSVVIQPTFTFPNAGSYNVMLIVEKGTACADTTVFTVNVMDPVAFNLNIDSVSCNGFSDGQAVASSNDPNYTYNWSTLQSGSSIQNLAIGNYWVYATNDIGCVDTQLFLIEEPNILQIQFNNTQPLCFGDSNGAIDALVTGGTSPYVYFWPAQSYYGNPLQNIGIGNYVLDVTDVNGCAVSASSNLSQPTPLQTVIVGQNNVSCFGMSDGSVLVQAIGGTPGYSIDWLTLINDSTYMNNLSAGNYIAEVTDANNCLSIVNATIVEPDTFFVNVNIMKDESCSASNGEAFADVTNGVGVITFLWTPGGNTTNYVTGLSAGPFQVIVQDENGCTASNNSVMINHPTGSASVGTIKDVSCQNGSDGYVEVLMSGGSPQFTYNWSCNCPNQNTASNLVAGNYWVEITDNYGCIDTLDFVINELPPLQVQDSVLNNPSCFGGADGQIQSIASGGTSPYSFEWDSNPAQFNALATGLSDGTFTVTVTDSNGCQALASVQLIEPTELIADAQVLGNNICFGDSAGVAQAQGVGGTQPYTYSWDNGDTTATISNLLAGFFNVVVTDNNGCQAMNSLEIIEYDSVFAAIEFDPGFCPGDIVDFIVSTNGLNNQYDYYWYVNHLLESTSNTFSFQIDDTSTVTMVLVNVGNCPSVVDSIVVGPIMMPTNNVYVSATPDTICFGSSATIQASLIDTSNVTSTWWNTAGLDGLGPHVVYPEGESDYILTIENSCGAQQSDTAHINVFMPPQVNITANGITGCDRITVGFDYSYDANYAYQFEGGYWNIGGDQYNEQSPSVNYSSSIVEGISLFLGFSNGCLFEFDTTISMTVFENPTADFYVNPDPVIVGELSEFIDVTFGNTQDWEWYVDEIFVSSDERPEYLFEDEGEYEVTEIIFDENGCSDTVTHLIEVIGSYTVFIPNAFTPDGNGVNNEFKPVVNNIDPDQYRFMIYNRWGELIYDTEIVDNSWDGTNFGENVSDGVYIWKVLVTDNVGIEHELVGHVTLLR
jgi:gliding motility-associated-like protein